MNIPILVSAMILTAMLGLLSIDIYTPSLPLIPSLFTTSVSNAQLTVGVFLGGLASTQFFSGMISDSHGRKPVLVTGLLLFLLGTVICIGASSITMLLLGRTIQGTGAGAVSGMSRILLKDVFSGVKMAQMGSYLGLAICLAPMLGPVLGGFIQQHMGFKAIFIFLLLFGLLLLYLSWFHLSETNQFKHLHQLSLKGALEKYRQVLGNKVFWANVLNAGCAFAAVIVAAMINPFLMQTLLNMSPAKYGLWSLVAMSGIFIGMAINLRLLPSYGVRNMMLLGMLLMCLVGLSFIAFYFLSWLSITTVIVPTFILEVGVAFILPNAMVGAFHPFPQIAGTVGAVYGCLQMTITALASSTVSLLEKPSLFVLGTVIVVLMLGSAGFYYRYGEECKHST